MSVDESGGTVTLSAVVTTTEDRAPDYSFNFTVTTADGTAAQPGDYTEVSETGTFAAGDFTQTDQPGDYTEVSETGTFAAGDFTQTDVSGQQRYRAAGEFTVSIVNDADDESDENFSVTLAYVNAAFPHLQGGNSVATVTINDDEHVPVTLDWANDSVTVNEGAGTATMSAWAVTTEDKRPEDGFSFDASISTSDGSAVQPGDYTQLSDTVTFSRNDFSRATVNGERRYRAVKQVQTPIVDDTEDGPDEDFDATLAYLSPTLPHLQGGPASATVTITDNDHVPVTISWDQSFVSVDEDATTVTLQARATTTLDKMPESGFNVALSATTADDTATQGSDYLRLTRSFSFGQGDFTRTDVGGQFRFQATRDISVSIINDTDDEPAEAFAVTLSYSNPSLPHLWGSPNIATVTITDNDHVPVTLGWEETAFTAEEPTSPGITTLVTLRAMAVTTTDKRPESGFTLDFAVNTANGTAWQPADYEQLSATETFDQGDFSSATVDGQSRWVAFRDFAVNVAHDTVDEPLERFTVRLTFVGPRQPHLTLGDSTATVTTTDDVASLADLRTTVSASSGIVDPGEQLTYDWSVANSGPSASTNASFTGTLDAGTSFVSAQVTSPATGQCSRSGRTVTCTFGTLELGGTASGEVVVEATATASADVRFTAIARADQLDRTPSNNDASATTELIAAPRRITNLRGSGASAHIDVTWSTPGDNGSPITRYELERKEAGGSYAPISPGPGVGAITYRDSQVTPGKTYTYQLRAVNADGDAEWSNEATATARETQPPPITGGGGGGGGAPPNNPPVFQDDEGNVITSTSREIADDAAQGAKIGEPVAATDPEEDTLTYTLDGEDAASFAIDASTGQLTTAAVLDYESQAGYTVTVIATDPSGATAEIRVTITVIVTEVEYDCSTGNAVADAADNPGLVSDCEALLRACLRSLK